MSIPELCSILGKLEKAVIVLCCSWFAYLAYKFVELSLR